ncbi:MATE family efflux transporter [Oceanicoccus sp. KOV_DT_Chl]|uniref:MATE family efflux transporter n=1 Tax=Oceanicoccus sp. KOV_DT_Chl TaxID=1904639 RepID=UPI001F442F85|nr:MATE family efflux transporter [Oceanicoccus sp. KOV_DT_Chl]
MPQRLLSLTTLQQLLRLALPMMVSQGTFALMIFTDRLFMAKLSAVHIAASMAGGMASFASLCLFTGVIAYGNALVAQYNGAGVKHKCSLVVTQGWWLALMSLPFVGLITWFVSDLFGSFGHTAQQVELERSYYLVLMASAIFSLTKVALASFFAGIGQTRVVMICDVLGVLINIPLTYVLVFGVFGFPAMGIVGAGLATLIASLVTTVLFLKFYCRPAIRERFSIADSLRLDRGILRRYLRLGIPSGLETLLTFGTFNIFLLLFQSYGVVEGAAIAIVFNWDILSFIPMMGVSIAVMTQMGHFVGAGDLRQANKVITAGFIIVWTYSGLLALVFIFFSEPLVNVFATPDDFFPEIRQLSILMMVGLASYVVADANSLVVGGALRGAGDTRWLMIVSIGLHWLMLLAQYLMIRVYQVEPIVSWWGFVAMILVLAVSYCLRLFGGVWRRPERLARVMAE